MTSPSEAGRRELYELRAEIRRLRAEVERQRRGPEHCPVCGVHRSIDCTCQDVEGT